MEDRDNTNKGHWPLCVKRSAISFCCQLEGLLRRRSCVQSGQSRQYGRSGQYAYIHIYGHKKAQVLAGFSWKGLRGPLVLVFGKLVEN